MIFPTVYLTKLAKSYSLANHAHVIRRHSHSHIDRHNNREREKDKDKKRDRGSKMNSTFMAKAALPTLPTLPTRLLSPAQIYRRQRLREALRKRSQCNTISSLSQRPCRAVPPSGRQVPVQFHKVCSSPATLTSVFNTHEYFV